MKNHLVNVRLKVNIALGIVLFCFFCFFLIQPVGYLSKNSSKFFYFFLGPLTPSIKMKPFSYLNRFLFCSFAAIDAAGKL